MSIENIFPNKQQFDTINERLLEIANNVAGGSSKLDKPTNPSAESAVTMLADGTVGTKPLSEIGGGKLYMHRVYLYDSSGTKEYNLIFYSSFLTKVNSVELIKQYEKYMTGLALDITNIRPAYYSANNGTMCINVKTNGNTVNIYYDEIISITDTVTEL